jgi:hypothetical protein
MIMKQKRFDWGIAIGIVLLLGFITIAILTLLGPATGSVFSNVVSNYSPGSYPGIQENSPSEVEPVAAVNPDEQMAVLLVTDRMIIRNGELYLLVKDTRQAVSRVAQIADVHGGYVLSSAVSGEGKQISADLTITVRADQFDAALGDLQGVALQVQSQRATGEDVSAEYVDLESQLRNLQATQTRLRTFLDDSATVTEALDVNEQLANIEGQIEQVKGRMNYLEEHAALSTIMIHLSMPQAPAPTPTQAPWALRPAIDRSIKVQAGLAHFLVEAVVWLIIVLGPYAVLAAFAAYGLRLWLNRKHSTP